MGQIVDAEIQIRIRAGNQQNLLSSAPRHRGDLIHYRVLPHAGWGKRDGAPDFAIFTVRDVDSAALETICQRNVCEPNFFCRTSHWINLDLLQPAQFAALEAGTLEITGTELYSRVNNRLEALRQLYGD